VLPSMAAGKQNADLGAPAENLNTSNWIEQGEPTWASRVEALLHWRSRGLTFELSWTQRRDALGSRRKMGRRPSA
jgi:hypothetical protein